MSDNTITQIAMEELQKENAYLKQRNQELMEQLTRMANAALEYESRIAVLEQKNRSEAEGSDAHYSQPGRKPKDETWQLKYRQFRECCNQGMRVNEVMENMKISRSTYYRFWREYLKELQGGSIPE